MTIHRNERILAYMTAAIVIVSIACFVAVIVGTAVGLDGKDFSTGIWPVILTLPLVGLPIGMILIIVLLIVSARRRAREASVAAAASPKKK